MRLTRVLAIAVIVASCGLGYVQAQTLSNAQVPAEFPPSSYTARQYVDSNGCVFVRAGIDGQVTWIPRVNRKRSAICGFKPSLSATARASAPKATQTTAAAEPTIITVPEAAPKKVTKRKVVKKTTTPKPVVVKRPKTVAATTVAATTAAPAVAEPVKVVKAPDPVKRVRRSKTGRQVCPGASALSDRYLQVKVGRVRCGPQTMPHVTYAEGRGATPTYIAPSAVQPLPQTQTVQPITIVRQQPTQITVSPAPRSVVATAPTRIVPAHVYKGQISSQEGIYVPEGYKPIWTDDRLNPYRAHQTYAGKAQMEVVWTKTVPRYLVERSTGRDVTYKYPGLQYPYTSFEDQSAAGVLTVTRGAVVQDPISVASLSDKGSRRVTRKVPTTAVASESVDVLTITTRSTAPLEPARAASHRYVRAAVYRDQADARRAAQKIANSGLPTRMGKIKRKGEVFTMVLAGPFKTQSQMNTGLQRVRGMGFSNATLRK